MTNRTSAPTPAAPYPPLLRAAHWGTAALMLAVLSLAWLMPDGRPSDGWMLMLHESLGLMVLALALARLAIRRRMPSAAEDAGGHWLEPMAARATHVLLYLILIAMPVSGYLSVAARGRTVSLFGLFDLPALLPVSSLLHDAAWAVHETGQGALYATVGLHVAASLFHLLVRRDGVVARMLPAVARFMPTATIRPAAR